MFNNREIRAIAFCVVVFLFLALLPSPFANSPFLDDVSYIKTAKDLADTGHLVYNGWASPMIGVQAYWGALWIKLLGFSFPLVRLTTLPVALGCVVLLYVLGRREGLSRRLAAFGSLVIMSSPLVLIHSLCFMTDVPAFLFFLLTILALDHVRHCFAEIETSASEGAATIPWKRLGCWLAAVVLFAGLGGTVRQVIWAIPALVLPYWVVRFRLLRVAPLATMLSLGAAIATVFIAIVCSYWFDKQPYVSEMRDGPAVRFLVLAFKNSPTEVPGILQKNTEYIWRIVLSVGLFLMPVALMALPAAIAAILRSVKTASALTNGVGICFFIASLMTGFLTVVKSGDLVMPWLGSPEKFYAFDLLIRDLSTTAQIIPSSVASFLSVLTWICVAVYLLLGCLLLSGWVSALWDKSPRTENENVVMTGAQEAMTLFSFFYCACLIIKLYVVESPYIWERYIIYFFPNIVFALLLLLQRIDVRYKKLTIASASIGALGILLYGWYSIATTHDYYAMLAARTEATDTLESNGIPRKWIAAGFEYDFWTQLTLVGYINNRFVKNPPDKFIPEINYSFQPEYSFSGSTPAIHPRFVLSISPLPQLGPVILPPKKFPCWLPPGERAIYVQSLSGPRTDSPPGATH